MTRCLMLIALLAATSFGCKGPTGRLPPVDHPVYGHQPPPEVADAEDAEEEDFEDEEEEDEEEDTDDEGEM